MIALAFGTPRKLPRASELHGRVVVLDIAFAYDTTSLGGRADKFEKITKRLIDGLGSRLAAWVDHHDHARHTDYRDDPRFVLATKAEHPACPEMVTPELVQRTGTVNTICCHTDFDGLCAAAKWMRGGIEPYAGADADARAIDTRIGTPSAIGVRFDRALRGRPNDEGLYGIIVRHLSTGLGDAGLWPRIDEAGAAYAAQEEEARRLARDFVRVHGVPHGVAFVDVTQTRKRHYDKTLLLLLGQERETIAVVVDGDTVSLAASFTSGVDFLALLGLSGGMPTRVSVPRARLHDIWRALRVVNPPPT